jgi:hypothetical protein
MQFYPNYLITVTTHITIIFFLVLVGSWLPIVTYTNIICVTDYSLNYRTWYRLRPPLRQTHHPIHRLPDSSPLSHTPITCLQQTEIWTPLISTPSSPPVDPLINRFPGFLPIVTYTHRVLVTTCELNSPESSPSSRQQDSQQSPIFISEHSIIRVSPTEGDQPPTNTSVLTHTLVRPGLLRESCSPLKIKQHFHGRECQTHAHYALQKREEVGTSCCFLWIDEAKAKDKTYIWVSV